MKTGLLALALISAAFASSSFQGAPTDSPAGGVRAAPASTPAATITSTVQVVPRVANVDQSARLAWADVDGDGKFDALVLPRDAAPRLLHGLGEGRFEEATAQSGLVGLPSAELARWVDFDADGWIDVYLGCAAGSRLLRGHGDGTFEDVTALAGLHHSGDRFAEWLDTDGNGRPELHVVADQGRLLYASGSDGGFVRTVLEAPRHAVSIEDVAATAVTTAATNGSPRATIERPPVGRNPAPTGRPGSGGGSQNATFGGTVTGTTFVGGQQQGAAANCFDSIEDIATTTCVQVSSVPAYGMIYPLGDELFIDAATGNVGVGTITPGHALEVVGKLVSGVNNTSTGTDSAVGGGANNDVSGRSATVSGGDANTASAQYATVGGGFSNRATGTRSTVAGGIDNAAGSSAFVGGGQSNDADFGFSAVAGGRYNGANATYATVGGGANNHATGQYGFVGGGGDDANPAYGNTASGLRSMVGGGLANTASADYAAIAGGNGNSAAGPYSFVGSGAGNSANGWRSMVPGGWSNVAAANDSFAAGYRAQALHNGSFVWSGIIASDFASTANDQFLVRAPGGVGIGTNAPGAMLDVVGTVRASDTIVSTKVGGAPLTVASVDLVTNLNADKLDGFDALAFSMLGTQIESSEIADDTIADADVSASAAIAGTKIAADFGSQNAVLHGDTRKLVFIETGSSPAASIFYDGAGVSGPNNRVHVRNELDGENILTMELGGNVGIGTSDPDALLHLDGDMILGAGQNGTGDAEIVRFSGNGSYWDVGVRNESNGSFVFGQSTTSPKFEITTTGRAIVDVLEITGGADLVESFETGEEACEPGAVLVIDPDHPGQLRLSTTPYDKKVAGVASGAGGVRPGIELGQDGLEGDTKVAMAGRVWVRCATENGAIGPGDRLTTSSSAGLAMRATDDTRTDGAVLGKAMSALDEGTGLVLVLVNLQ